MHPENDSKSAKDTAESAVCGFKEFKNYTEVN